jgi:hypothetical protein
LRRWDVVENAPPTVYSPRLAAAALHLRPSTRRRHVNVVKIDIVVWIARVVDAQLSQYAGELDSESPKVRAAVHIKQMKILRDAV